MNLSRRLSWRKALWLVPAAAALPLLAVTQAGGAAVTLPIAGTIRSQLVTGPACPSPIGLCLSGNFYGSITGPNEAVGFFASPQPDNVLFGKSHVVIHTRDGDLRCTSSSSFDLDPASGNPFSDLCIITGGTGKYAGASGWFHTFGTGSATGNHADYRGTLKLQ